MDLGLPIPGRPGQWHFDTVLDGELVLDEYEDGRVRFSFPISVGRKLEGAGADRIMCFGGCDSKCFDSIGFVFKMWDVFKDFLEVVG